MIDQKQKSNEACELYEKPLYHNKDKIISCLSLLEKLYEKENKDSDKMDPKRVFLINKALNSVKKYSNLKVSPFKLSKSPLNKEEQKVQDKCDIVVEKEKEDSDINDIMCLIEKELKLNGIDVNDINDNSFMSTSQKSPNSDSNQGTENNKSNNENSKNNDSDMSSKNETHAKSKNRLSKLFLKIELKLKTFLQEEQEKDSKLKLAKEKGMETGDYINNIKGINKNLNISNNDNNNNKLSKKPYKMPELENSFFSNKKTVETMLSKAKKQKRKSMMEFNALNLLKAKNDNSIYIEDDNGNKIKKRIATALLKRPQKEKIVRNVEKDMISNFCGKIDEIAENKEEYEDIVPFNKVDNENILNNETSKNRNSIINPAPIFIDNNISSIKITSTINRNKLDINKLNIKENEEISLYKNEPISFMKFNDDESAFLDDDLLVKSSSEKEATSDSKNEEDEEEENSNCSNKDCDVKEEIKENSENKAGDENNISDNSTKRPSNFNYFYRNSIFSPLKEIEDNKGIDNDINEKLEDLHL